MSAPTQHNNSMTANAPSRLDAALLAGMPILFVVLWSTGFIGAKFGLPYAEPFTFLLIRSLLTLALLIPLVVLIGHGWPAGWQLRSHIAVSGLLVHGAYLGGVFYGIYLVLRVGLELILDGFLPLLISSL